jgi:type II secretory pathway pseudopilin PulG
MTLIELMTVIAIVAVLAALLLPVIGSVRETGRQATCQANLHSIGIAVSAYRDDNSGEFPPMLLGPAEDATGNPITTGAKAVPMESMKHAFLYPKYIKDISTFRCPDNAGRTDTDVTEAIVTSDAPDAIAKLGWLGFVWPSGNEAIRYYAADSYDITASPLNSSSAQVVYARDWTGAIASAMNQTPVTGTADTSAQMKYRNAPLDQTVVSWCNYHAVVNGASMSMVLLASGTVKTVPASVMATRGWKYASPD